MLLSWREHLQGKRNLVGRGLKYVAQHKNIERDKSYWKKYCKKLFR